MNRDCRTRLLVLLVLLPCACGDTSQASRDAAIAADGTVDGRNPPLFDSALSDAGPADGVPSGDGPLADATPGPLDGAADLSAVQDSAGSQPDGPLADGSVADGAAGSATCSQIIACASSCATLACVQTCQQLGTHQAQQQFGALESCLTTAESGVCAADCSGPSPADCQSCMTQACMAELASCYGVTPMQDGGTGWPDASWSDGSLTWPDGSLPGPDGGTTFNCSQLAQCVSSCAPSDNACFNACWNSASPTAQSQLNTMLSCLGNEMNGSCASSCVDPYSLSCDSCLNTACYQEITTCYGSP